MVQRTHDLGAVIFVSWRLLSMPPPQLTWETVTGIVTAVILGATLPDIDNISSPVWRHRFFPWEGRDTRETLMGHRHLTHSLAGLVIFVLIWGFLLQLIHLPGLDIPLVQETLVWAYLSHLVLDSLTYEGIPLLFPLHINMGFPPFKWLRLKSGGWIEKLIVFPALLICLFGLYYYFRQNLSIIISHIRT